MVVVRDTVRRRLSAYFEVPAVKLLTKVGVSPNALTILGVLLASVVAYLLSEGYFLLGSVSLLMSAFFDQLDGALARASGRVTRFGGFFDSVADRISELVVFFGLLLFYLEGSNVAQSAILFVAAGTSMIVSYTRARAGGLRVDCAVGVITRTERVVILVVVLAVGEWWLAAITVGLTAIASLSAITLVHRVLHVRRALSESNE